MPTEELVLPEAPTDPSPTISIGDVFTYLPLLEKIIAGITTAIANGSFTIPLITIKAFGKKLQFGPVPIRIVP